ncbi:MAG: GtrA family protein [Candidatus Falkowbacteria bacterium]
MSIFLNIFAKLKNFVSRRYPRLFNYLLQHKSFVKFFMAGPVVGAVDLLVLFVMHGLLNISVIWSTSLAYIISFWASFYLQKFFTFCNHNKKHVYRQMALYLLFAFINFNINGYLMHVMVNNYNVWYILAQVIVSLSIGLESFLVYKFIVFRKHHDDI